MRSLSLGNGASWMGSSLTFCVTRTEGAGAPVAAGVPGVTGVAGTHGATGVTGVSGGIRCLRTVGKNTIS